MDINMRVNFWGSVRDSTVIKEFRLNLQVKEQGITCKERCTRKFGFLACQKLTQGQHVMRSILEFS